MARKVLLADDSVTAQNMGRKILTEAGYEVITVNNGSAALKKINELKPDLIVLDVYMPGYGGLEICQRLKENAETARIPVLLTVGKLEPFKAEDARRVRADMHMIKPFEASELLTALTRLEDRIVPQGPVKGRKAGGNAEDQSADTERFGDDEAGWKNRIIMPKGKPEEAERPSAVEPAHVESGVEAKSKSLRDLLAQEAEAVQPEEKKFDVEAAKAAAAAAAPVDVPAHKLPEDITAEEIAAIAAAAAAFQRVELSGGDGVPVAKVETAPETKPELKFESEPETKPEPKVEVESAIAAPPIRASDAISFTKSAKVSIPLVAAEAAKEELPVPPVAVQSEAQNEPSQHEAANVTQVQAEEKFAVLEETTSPATRVENLEAEEVAAALAGIGPSAADDRTATPAGAHWIAEPVAVSAKEDRALLAVEMERAYAALTPTEANASSFSLAPLEELSVAASRQFSLDMEAQTFTLSREPAVSTAKESERPQPAVTVEEIASPVAETAAAAVPEMPASADAVAEPEAESRASFTAPAEAMSESGAARSRDSEPVTVASVPIEEAAKVPDEQAAPVAALAAAASAAGVFSASAIGAAAIELAPEPRENVSQQKEAELAAAWRSWREVRGGATGEPSTKESFKESRGDSVSAKSVEEAKAEALASEAQGDAEQISSIVDTMLAELKPKLMQEIARKMSKEKDKK